MSSGVAPLCSSLARGRAAAREAAGRCLASIALLAGLVGVVVGCPADAAARPPAPDWVASGGRSAAHPDDRWLTGFASSRGDERLVRARAAAAADLASRVVVRIEHELRDVETTGRLDEVRVASITRSTSDVTLHGIQYLVYETRERSAVLAVLDRRAAAAARRRERDRALVEVRACLASAEMQAAAGRPAEATRSYERCRTPVAAALEHDAVASALLPAASAAAAHEELIAATFRVDESVAALRDAAFQDLRVASRAIAARLVDQRVAPRSVSAVAPFTFGTTGVSSEFGRRAAHEVEAALAARTGAVGGRARRSRGGAISLRGIYLDRGGEVRLTVTARDVRTGGLLASAEAVLAKSAAGAASDLRPSNFFEALADQRLLAEDALRRDDLRIELWTSRGRRDLVYEAGEQLALYLRANRPCWVRLVYVLQGGLKVPIDQAFEIAADDVGAVIEYPERFEVVSPFGVEHVHATAFTREPDPVPTRRRRIGGVDYEVMSEGLAAIVRTRGLRRLGRIEMSESLVTLTTMPAPGEPMSRR